MKKVWRTFCGVEKQPLSLLPARTASNSSPNDRSPRNSKPRNSPHRCRDNLGRIEKNWFDCIRSGATPLANIDLALRTHTVLCLAEMSERLSLTLLFDEKTRTIRTGEGKVIRPISYDTILPVSA